MYWLHLVCKRCFYFSRHTRQLIFICPLPLHSFFRRKQTHLQQYISSVSFIKILCPKIHLSCDILLSILLTRQTMHFITYFGSCFSFYYVSYFHFVYDVYIDIYCYIYICYVHFLNVNQWYSWSVQYSFSLWRTSKFYFSNFWYEYCFGIFSFTKGKYVQLIIQFKNNLFHHRRFFWIFRRWVIKSSFYF